MCVILFFNNRLLGRMERGRGWKSVAAAGRWLYRARASWNRVHQPMTRPITTKWQVTRRLSPVRENRSKREGVGRGRGRACILYLCIKCTCVHLILNGRRHGGGQHFRRKKHWNIALPLPSRQQNNTYTNTTSTTHTTHVTNTMTHTQLHNAH